MENKKYYSYREKQRKSIDLKQLIECFKVTYDNLENNKILNHADEVLTKKVGYWTKLNERAKLCLHKDLLPVWSNYKSYSKDDIFDLIEFLFDAVSVVSIVNNKVINDTETAQISFVKQVNTYLNYFGDGYELTRNGIIQNLPITGTEDLLIRGESIDEINVESKVEHARNKFLSHSATVNDKREAIRTLADVLEYLRPLAKSKLQEKDESDLFNIANNFGIRHHKNDQKTKYSKDIWYEWMFYYCLTTIVMLKKLIIKND